MLQFGFALIVLLVAGAVALDDWHQRNIQRTIDALRGKADATYGEMAVTDGEEA